MSERELKIHEVIAESQQLRTVVASVYVVLPRESVLDSIACRPLEKSNAEHLLHEAEECFRCAGISELKGAVGGGLAAAGRKLTAKPLRSRRRSSAIKKQLAS